MISPASAWRRIRRVVDTFSARRNSVVNSSIDGNVEKANARGRYSDSISITVEIIRFTEIRRSIIHVGNGTISKPMMNTTRNASTKSPKRLNAFVTLRSFPNIYS